MIIHHGIRQLRQIHLQEKGKEKSDFGSRESGGTNIKTCLGVLLGNEDKRNPEGTKGSVLGCLVKRFDF